jgi:hypothetical protein
MKLYKLPSSNFELLFGKPRLPGEQTEVNPVTDVLIIAQSPDCSSFLVLSKTNYEALEPFTSYDGYDFTYCQQWGLTINEEVVVRTISDLRKNAYPPMANYLDAIVKNDNEALQTYLDACLAVKEKYTKLEF